MVSFIPNKPKEGFDGGGPQDRFLILESMASGKQVQEDERIVWENHMIVEAW